jgi:hypothetical protein
LTTPNVGGAWWTPALVQTAVQKAAYTASPNQLVPVDTTSGSITVTLPTGTPNGSIVAVKMVTLGGSNTVTINAVAGDVFDKPGGSTSSTLSLLGQGKVLQYQAGIWLTLADDLPLSGLDARYDQSSVLTTLGDMLYENSTPAPARLPGSTSATKNFLTQTGTGSASAEPAWGTIASGDLPAATSSAQGAVVIGGTNFAPVSLGAENVSAAQTANLLCLYTVPVPAPVTLTGLVIPNGATATGNVLAGIYNTAGTSLLASSASTGQTGTARGQFVPFSATYAAAAGTYILALMYSSSSATASTAVMASPTVTAAQGGFTLPTSVTPPTATGNVTALPDCSTY